MQKNKLSQKLSIKDIAKLASVSTATVSYVINGSPKVRPQTRQRVQQVIDEYQYRPNDIAKSLKGARTNTIGVVAEDVTVFNVPEIIDGINDYADRNNKHILLTNLRVHKRIGRRFDEQLNIAKFATEAIADLQSKQVEGIIYIGVHYRDVTNLIESQNVPVIFTYCFSSHAPSILIHDEKAMYDATKYLIKLGHTRIGLISGLLDSYNARLRWQGYCRAISDHGLEVNHAYIRMGNWEEDTGYLYTKELLDSSSITALMTMNDVMAVGALRACRERKVAVPEQLSLIGFDNRDFCDYVFPRLTSIYLPLHELGYQAIEQLMNLIDGASTIATVQANCRIIERDSVQMYSNQ